DLPDPVRVVNARGAEAGHLLGVDDVLDRGRLPAPPGHRPVDRRPPALVQAPLPVLAPLLGAFDPAGGAPPAGIVVAAPVGQELGDVLLEPAAQLVAERLVLGGVGEVHGYVRTCAMRSARLTSAATAGRAGSSWRPRWRAPGGRCRRRPDGT